MTRHPVTCRPATRSGVSAILIVVLLFVFIVCAAMTVDIAYMQLIRTQLRAATDAAATAAAENLARTDNTEQAVRAAQDYARANVVAGNPFALSRSDIIFGRVRENVRGGYDFTAHQTPPNAVRVHGRLADDAATGPARLFFSRALGHGDFSTQLQAVAAANRVEICLTIDRSSSMSWDMTGLDWSYTGGHPLLVNYPGMRLSWRYFLSPPHPAGSRWAATSSAVDLFLQEVGESSHQPRVSLVSWASDTPLNVPPWIPYRRYPAMVVEVPLPAVGSYNWNDNATNIQRALAGIASEPLIGRTNMSAGLQAAIGQLQSTSTSAFATKVVILLSDGRWTQGRHPVRVAREAKSQDIIVHCVSLLSGDDPTMRQVAEITGGQMYVARNVAQLRSAFQQIARELPVSLTE